MQDQLLICTLGLSDKNGESLKNYFTPTGTTGGQQQRYTIDNKYYTATIDIGYHSALETLPKNINALVIAFEEFEVDKMSRYLNSLMDTCEPDICVIVDYSNTLADSEDHDIPYVVEIIPTSVSSGDTEKFGLDRLDEILNAHLWPSHTLKKQLIPAEAEPTENPTEKDEVSEFKSTVDAMLGEGEESALKNDQDHFETILAQFAGLKSTCAKFPHEKRRDYAEKVALAFAQSLFADEEFEE